MSINPFLLIMFCIALLVILFLFTKLRRVRGQLSIIEEALEDIKSGNLNRRMLTKKNDMTRKICYGINEIAMIKNIANPAKSLLYAAKDFLDVPN